MATVEEALALAVGHHEQGRLDEAEALYARIIEAAPRSPHAHHLLGVLRAQTGRYEAAVAGIRTAIGLHGRIPGYHVNLANALKALGRWAEAADAFAAAAALEPGEPAHRIAAGDVHRAAGRAGEACAQYAAALKLRPNLPELRRRLVMALADAGRHAEAARHLDPADPATARETALATADALLDRGEAKAAAGWYAVALCLDPAAALAWHNRGIALRDGGQTPGAVRAFARTVRLAPGVAPAWANLCGALQTIGDTAAARRALAVALLVEPGNAGWLAVAGRLDRAPAALRRAVLLDPQREEVLFDLAALHFAARAGGPAAGCLRRVLACAPDSARAWTSLGSVVQENGDAATAVGLHRRALRLDPAGVDGLAHSNLGVALMGCGRLGEAVDALRHAVERTPDDPYLHSNLLFCLCFADAASTEEVFGEHRRYGERHAVPPRPGAFAAVDRDPERRLRVGYLSPDFQRYPGPAFHYLLPVFENHDPARFAVFGYQASPNADAVTGRFRATAAGWRVCAGLDDDATADLIRADGIDILVDCAGHMALNRLPVFARRPAPLQIGYPLYPNTSGMPAIDYRVVDPHFAPPWADRLHTEALIRLPHTHAVYRAAPSPCAPPARPPVEEAGVFTFASFNNVAKLSRETIAAWARILDAVPDSRLMLKWRGLAGPLGNRVAEAFRAEGVDGGRLVLRGPTADPYEAYGEVDLCLDPLFANGGTTTCDALWMGVPVVTLCGERFFSRVGLLHLTNAGLSELVAHTVADYHALAVRAARDRGWLASLRQNLRARFAACPAMDEALYVRHLEAAYRTVWRRWCAGEPATPLTLAP